MNKALLVNKENKIKENYLRKLELINIKNINDKDILIEKETYQSFLDLRNFLLKQNIDIGIKSAYYDGELDKNIMFIEKHTGLCIDISIRLNNKYIEDKTLLLEQENVFSTIHKYLNNFGFILRYPKDKEKITDNSYIPWHYRYVGKIPATIISKNNLCLEEYHNKFSGVLVVNKEKNMTSFDVVNKVSKILGIKKIGHTGTLDPMAEGVLVLTIGKATKIGELLTSYEKEYVATAVVGILTDTLDTTGKVIDKKEPSNIINYKKICSNFEKTYLQEVPIYSAVKVNGRKLYEYARENKKVILPKKEVTIQKIELLENNETGFTFKTLVSKGTYIRSLIRDMGNSINEYFIMSSLIRTKQGNFSIDDAYSIEDINNNNFEILSIKDVLTKYPIIKLTDETLIKKVTNGAKLNNIFQIKDKCLFTINDSLIAIYQQDEDFLRAWKIFK